LRVEQNAGRPPPATQRVARHAVRRVLDDFKAGKWEF
jgi:hypothetical protein